MGAISSSLISGLLDSTYTPTRNPDATKYDPQSGTYHNDAGEAVPLYTQPNTFQRIVSPTAREFSGLNAQQGAASLIAQQQAAIKKQTAVERMRPAIQGFFGDKMPSNAAGTTADIMYGSDMDSFDPTAAMNLGRQYRGYQNGILNPMASSDVSTAQNTADYQKTRGLLGVPGTEAGLESTSGNLGIVRNLMKQGGMSLETQNYRLGQENEGLGLLSKNQTLPHENAVSLAKSVADERNIPLTFGKGGAADLDAMNQYMRQRFGVNSPDELYVKPRLGETTTSGWNLPDELNPHFSPAAFANMQYLANGGVMGGKGQLPTATLPGGEPLPMKPDPDLIRPTVGGGGGVPPPVSPPPKKQTKEELQQQLDEELHTNGLTPKYFKLRDTLDNAEKSEKNNARGLVELNRNIDIAKQNLGARPY